MSIEEKSRYVNDAVELLKELIATPRASRNETEAADVMEQRMTQWGLNPQREANNLWAVSDNFNKAKQTILLNAHIDTVKPVKTWTHAPYEPEIIDDKLFGIGANDCGGGLVTLLQVFRILKGRKLPFNLIYLASAEEEVSGKDGVERVLPLLPKIDVAIVGEPTGMQPAIAEKGLMVIDGYTRGVSGHAARNEGVNAIYKALDDLVWLRDYKFRKESPLLGFSKMTVTQVESGTQHNVIPDSLHFVIDVRTNEYYQNEFVFSFLQKHMQNSILKARSFRLHSSSIPTDHPLVKRCVKLGMKPFGSPTLSDQALMPFPSFKLGPGESSRSHSANEFIRISEIERALDTYLKIIL